MKERLDKLLVELGYAPTREKAQALIMAGLVLVDGKVVDKPGHQVKREQRIEVKEPIKYVSRGGYKLEHALENFGLDVHKMVALDVGSSTGGFTDCLLQRGVDKVYAVDVGKGQMDPKLRQDPRVILYEETDIREVTQEHIPEKVDIAVVDVSFISATKVLPHVVPFLKEEGLLLVLVKPQFEVGPKFVKKGVVKDREAKRQAIIKVVNFIRELGYKIGGIIKSKPKGSKGNEEFFVLAGRSIPEVEDINKEVDRALEQVV
ncbi:TlyA family RNA methyltransferase [Thermocrinis minervae]|uniref:23S rRNA (Cytidine1920-2'-O)/16S rRNA (Cytidine1409-2'-O)-methyltransferase n=1 Tax=Thermocrinis minervae TaxID=381751 RepID=A0A1M6RYE7_9AQUI|nr:TlyA family RNA methyltransferase [Thermocrinis minervae]SHK37535.1 23S rRNA (cytidine1920-2'-O)/16S rRNA (cytidine1409-2'-O)-methyltransferase [Thermocrinis minervae]